MFKVGELAVFSPTRIIMDENENTQTKEGIATRIGSIVEILRNDIDPNKDLKGPVIPRRPGIWYKIIFTDDTKLFTHECHLQKLPPPPHKIAEIGSWDTIHRETGYKVPTRKIYNENHIRR